MICSSLSWPNMFDVARSRTNLYSNQKSITNRVKLLLLSEPTELYMEPNFGVGLRKYMFQYNNDNVIAMIKDELIEQLRLWEPGVIPDDTVVERKPTPAWNPDSQGEIAARMNKLELRVTLHTIYEQYVSFDVDSSDIEGLM